MKLTVEQERVFAAYKGLDDGTGFHFKDLQKRTGLLREEIRLAVHHLAQLGYLAYFRAGTTDEGEFYGAGYALTREGYGALIQYAEFCE